MKPLKNYILPDLTSQNFFGAKRKYDIHTGVDLFCNENDDVYSVYDGIVTSVVEFTGFEESPWWNDTHAIMIYHHEIQKTFLYGEIKTDILPGSIINAGQLIGNVLTVLKEDKGKPMTMLHMECYNGIVKQPVWWYLNEECPKSLEDITKYLK